MKLIEGHMTQDFSKEIFFIRIFFLSLNWFDSVKFIADFKLFVVFLLKVIYLPLGKIPGLKHVVHYATYFIAYPLCQAMTRMTLSISPSF